MPVGCRSRSVLLAKTKDALRPRVLRAPSRAWLARGYPKTLLLLGPQHVERIVVALLVCFTGVVTPQVVWPPTQLRLLASLAVKR